MQDGPARNARTRKFHRGSGSTSDYRGSSERKNPRNDIANAKRNYERYMALARSASLAGDTVEMENCYQHAEHYFRVIREQAT